jgi:hypothetical protein
MSDGLVKRLRDLGDRAEYMPHMYHVAADRIEELEAKLANAIEFAEIVEQCGHGALWDLARTTLAELKGAEDADRT